MKWTGILYFYILKLNTSNSCTMKKIFTFLAIALITCTSLFAADYYWVGNSGNWTDYAGHWATTSGGGTYHTQAPTMNDNVYFDANSFLTASHIVTVDANAACADMDWTGALNDPEFYGVTSRTLSIHGSLTLIEDMNFNFLGTVYFEAISTGKTITSAGQSFKRHVYFNNLGGWELQDGFLQTGSYPVYLNHGTLDLNDMPMTVVSFNTNNTNVRTMIMGDSIFTITSSISSAFYFRGTNFTFQADSSLIRFTAAGADLNQYSGSGTGLSFYDVIFEAATNNSIADNDGGSFNTLTFNSNGTVSGGNTIDTLTFTGAGTIKTNGNSINVVEFNDDATIENNGTYDEVTISGSGLITGSNTFGDLTFAAGKSYTFDAADNQLINGTLTANGSCSAPITIQSDHLTNHTTLTKTSGSVSIDYCVLQGVHAAGGVPFSASHTVNMGNNTGWSITEPDSKDLYWIGGEGDWNDPAHWSTSSGGGTSGCIPNALDDVFFDGNSGFGTGETVTIIGDEDDKAYCNNMTWTGALNSPSLGGASPNTLNIYGSLTFIAAMSFDFSGLVYFRATETGETITTAGLVLDNNDLYFDGEGGEWTLQDDLDLGDEYLRLLKGSLITNNHAVDVRRFYSHISTYARALTLGSSEMTITDASGSAFYYHGDNFTLNAGTSTIRLTGANADIDRVAGAGLVFHDVIFEATTGTSYAKNYAGSFNTLTFNSTGYLTGDNTIDSITFNGTGTINTNGNNINTTVFHSGATIKYAGDYGKVTMNGNGSITGSNTFDTLIFTAGNQYTLTYNKIQTIVDTLIANGTGTQYIIIKSSSAGSQSTIRKTGGAVTVSYVQLQDNYADGTATFTANNSISLGNNTNWTFFSPSTTDYYWIGGTGNYNVAANWSLSSGGSPGTGVPLLVDNAIFDDQSFSPGDVVTLVGDASNKIRINDMDWSAATNNPTLAGASDQTLCIHGSLTLNPAMSYTFLGPVYFTATKTGETITTAGLVLDNNDLYFDGEGGEWTLQDDLDLGDEYLRLLKGSLITNNHAVDVRRFYSHISTYARALTLGSSEMTITDASGSAFYYHGDNFTLNAGTSTIRLTGANADIDRVAGAGLVFHDVIFEATTGTSYAKNYAGSFNTLTFNSTGYLTGDNTIDSITFNGTGTINTNGNNINTTVFHSGATIKYAGDYGKVTMNGNGSITGSNTFDTLIFTAGNQYTLTYNKIQTIENELIAEGTPSDLIVIKSSSSGSHSSFNKITPGDVTVNYVSLQDNHAGTVTFTANNSVNLGNTTGWTINSAGTQDYYWVGGTGNYNDASHWSFSSGGANNAGVPTGIDNVFFDANSFLTTGQIVYIVGDASNIARANNMDWTGAANSPELAGASTQSLYIHGSLTLIPGMTYTFAGPVHFKAEETGETITTAGVVLDYNGLYFDGVGGEWTLQDDLDLGDEYLRLQNGSLITNNHAVDARRFYSNNTNVRALTLGSSEMTITEASGTAFYYNGDNFTLNAGTSTIRFTGANADLDRTGGAGLAFYNVIFEAATGTSIAENSSGSFNNLTFNSTGIVSYGNTIDSVTFNGNGTINDNGNNFNTTVFHAGATINGNGDYGKVTMNGNGTINGTNTFDTLVFTPGNTYTLDDGEKQIIDNLFVADGTCSASIVIQSTTTAKTTIEKASGAVTVHHCNLEWIEATGGATFTAQNSINLGNNTGWAFTVVPLDLYWVDGTGNWDDVDQWASSSGGSGGYCIPTQSDNVYFDNNSFSQTGQAVYVNIADASCRSMDWTGAGYSPTFTSTSPSNNLHIHGSLILNPNMNFAFSGNVYFEGQTPTPLYTITSAGHGFNNNVYFNGSGGIWTLQDDLSTSTKNLYLNHGTLNTNGHTVSVSRFISTNDNTRAMNLGSSVFNIGYGSNQAWYVNGANFSIVPGTSEIRLTTANGGFQSNGASNLNYYNVLFQNGGGSSILNSNDSFNTVTFNPTGHVTGGGTYGALVMSLGGLIQGNSTYGSTYFYGNTTINGNNTFARLLLGDGNTFTFQAGATQIVTGRFIIWGTAGHPITIISSISGTRATISKAAGTVLGNYVHLKDMAATGGSAPFNLYSSVNNGNNVGWNFLSGTNLTLPSTTITPGPPVCYEATEIITVGGGGNTFVVQNGGSAKLIAGFKVQLLRGTRIHHGGYLNAYITPDGFFCDTVSTMPMPPPDIATGAPDDQLFDDDPDNSFFRLYPNPTAGLFTLELKEKGVAAGVEIEITSLMGERITKRDMPSGSSYQIDLTGKQPGIYLVRVIQDNRIGIRKLIKQ